MSALLTTVRRVGDILQINPPLRRVYTSATGAVHKVRDAIFGQFLPPSHCHTLSHIPGPPRFFSRPSTKIRTKAPCTNSLSIVRGIFVRGVCQGVFCLEVFVRGSF